jgi:hypothetical protein
MGAFSRGLLLGLAMSVSTSTAGGAEDIPSYSERPLSPAELHGKTLRELELLRATIHARAGFVFLDWWLWNYFSRASWYTGGGYDPAKLSAVDRENLRTLAAYQGTISPAELRRRWDDLVLDHRYVAEPTLQHRLAISADGSAVAVGASPLLAPRWPLELFRTATGERMGTVPWAGRQLLAVELTQKEVVIVTDYEARVGGWAAPRARLAVMIGEKPNSDGSREPPPLFACVSPDGRWVVAETRGAAMIWNLATGQGGPSFPLPPGQLLSNECSFLDSERAFVKRDRLGPGLLLDVRAQSVATLTVPRGESAIAPNGAWLARWDAPLGGIPGEVELWKLAGAPQRVRVLTGSAGTMRAAFSPDGTRLLTADADGKLWSWNCLTGARSLWRYRTRLRSFEATSEDALDGASHFTLEADAAAPASKVAADLITALAFSRDGVRVVASSQGGSLELFDARTGSPVPGFRGHRPWTEEELWEAALLSRRLGMPLPTQWPRAPKFVDPLKHLSALDAPLPEGVIQGASRAQLRLLRNAIIARRGALFESRLLQSLFTETSWYRPVPSYTAERLTTIDRENILRIKRRERALGGSLGDHALKAAIDRASAAPSN